MSLPAAASAAPAAQHIINLSPRDIPPLPDAMAELLGIANDPDVPFARLTQVISRDQALTLRVLAVANSPYYGCSRRIDSVRSAVAVLGTRQVQNIASAMALAPAFQSDHGPRLWQHGLCTALWTQRLVRALGVPPLDYVFTAGLLHDIGVVLLLGNAPEAERACIDQAEAEGRELADVERAHLGTDHAQLGARACTTWKLPTRLAELVGQHHDSTDGGLDLQVLQAANTLAGVCEDPTATEPALGALQQLDLPEADALALLEHAGEVLAEAGAFG